MPTHAELRTEAEAFNSLEAVSANTFVRLKAFLRAFNLPTAGNKDTLVNRLAMQVLGLPPPLDDEPPLPPPNGVPFDVPFGAPFEAPIDPPIDGPNGQSVADSAVFDNNEPFLGEPGPVHMPVIPYEYTYCITAFVALRVLALIYEETRK
jgi:hypothetical protein